MIPGQTESKAVEPWRQFIEGKGSTAIGAGGRHRVLTNRTEEEVDYTVGYREGPFLAQGRSDHSTEEIRSNGEAMHVDMHGLLVGLRDLVVWACTVRSRLIRHRICSFP